MFRATKFGATAVCALALALSTPAVLHAEEEPALLDLGEQPAGMSLAADFVGTLGRQAVTIVADGRHDARGRHENLKSLIREGFHLETIGRFVLGRYWREAGPEQRAEFQDLFAEHLLNSYARQLDSYRTETLHVGEGRPVGRRDVLVETAIETDDGPLKAGWRVRAIDGQPKIVDVVIDGMSLTLTQRQEIGAVATKLGVDGLLGAMRDKAAEEAQRLAQEDGVSDNSARVWMLFSFVGSSGSAMQVSLARQ